MDEIRECTQWNCLHEYVREKLIWNKEKSPPFKHFHPILFHYIDLSPIFSAWYRQVSTAKIVAIYILGQIENFAPHTISYGIFMNVNAHAPNFLTWYRKLSKFEKTETIQKKNPNGCFEASLIIFEYRLIWSKFLTLLAGTKNWKSKHNFK